MFILRTLTIPEDLQDDARPTTILDGMTTDVQRENAERSSRKWTHDPMLFVLASLDSPNAAQPQALYLWNL